MNQNFNSRRNKQNRTFLILLIFLFIIEKTPLLAIDYDPELLEKILEKVSEETGSSPLVDEIERYIEKPIYLRYASVGELLQVPGFPSSLARKIINDVRFNKDADYDFIFKKYSLQPEQDYLLRLCTTFDEPKNYKQNTFVSRIRYQDYLQQVKGFRDSAFAGDELNLYQRTTLYYKEFSAGILTDKDAGERSLTDFKSGYITADFYDTKIIAGDYYVENGMGSLLWKNFALRKGAEVIYPAVSVGGGIKPYRSSVDFDFFRGIAFQRDWKLGDDLALTSIAWYSSVDRSASIDTIRNIATSLYTSGFYRTESELSKKDKINEKTYGSSLELKSGAFSIGATAFNIEYSKAVQSQAQGAFYGKSGILASAYSYLNLENQTYGVEVSKDAQNHVAAKAGVQLDLGKLSAAFHFRSYPSGFRSPFGYNFGESSYPSNEIGFYTGLKWNQSREIQLSAYLDLYRNYAKTYTLPSPGRGVDIFGEVNWNPSRETEFSCRINLETKTDAMTPEGSDEKITFDKAVRRLRFEYESLINPQFTLRCRTEGVWVNFEGQKPDEYGLLCFADLKWLIDDWISLEGRLTYFNTESYESAIWQYEAALPGYFTTTALYGKGVRGYLIAAIYPLEYIDFIIKYSITYKPAETELGSGWLEIEGNRDARLYLQLDVNL